MDTETLMTVFGWIGIFVVGGGVLIMAYCAFDSLRDIVRSLRWHYTYKRRFDKPPTAKCYCKDCRWHIDDGVHKNKCTNITWADRYTPDNGFCYDAEPKARDNNADD